LAIVLGVIVLPGADAPLADLKSSVIALDLKPGAVRLEPKPTAASLAALKTAAARNPKLADYTAFFLATAQFDSQDFASVPATVERVFTQLPPSPLTGQAALLAARALENNGRPADAAALLRNRSRALPQPQGDLETARAMLSAGDQPGAAIYAQRVYYGYPASIEAGAAQAIIATLQTNLAERYPPVLGSTLLSRALKLLDAGDGVKAKRELVALSEGTASPLAGAERDAARVKIGVADYVARNHLAAQRYLKALTVESPAADAERIYYLFLCARRASDRAGMDAALAQFARLYPSSPFRVDALTAFANISLVENQPETYEPLYRACSQVPAALTGKDKIAQCHWRVTWLHYLQRRPDSSELLREHLRLFPDSENASAALYYLSRTSEAKGDRATSAAYDREIARRYPNRYYGVLARTRTEEQPALRATVSQPLADFPPSPPAKLRSYDPNVTSRLRIERAHLLASAELEDWAGFELRYAASHEDQPHLTALELARLEAKMGLPEQALHDLKHFVPDYLSLEMTAMDATQREFWQLAFPLPYRADLERFARDYDMDPFLMAALIRQESEFNPKAISAANARGLTQIMPATGRDLSRRLGLRTYTLTQLFLPQVNLRMGTYYLKSIADHLAMGRWETAGRWEAALAAYNAGLTRVDTWSKWSAFREPAEFVETIPFTQTREYVQIVMRNADIYRRLYPAQAGLPVARVSYPLEKLPAEK
jgi:soluble lytic murein transglycosylase